MPAVAGAVTTYDVQGKPRDLSEIIYDISPTDTPFLTMCKRAKATQTIHEWTTDALAAPADNAWIEGAETNVFEGSAVEEKHNHTQILKKAVQVTGTAQAIKEVGVANQYRRQLAQRMKELKKDLEYALLANQIDNAATTATARKLRGLPCFIDKNVDLGAGGAVATAAAPVTAGTLRALDEDMLRDVIRQCYEAGGNVDRIMSAPIIRSQVSKLLRSDDNRTDNIKNTEVTATVEVYVSDYGNIKIIPNRVQANVPYSKSAIYLLDPEYWAVAYLRSFREEQLAKTGDSMKGHIIVEPTLEARQPDSSGMIADLLDVVPEPEPEP
jgi:hypothetical protein